ncbi:MAG: hypothetical protein HC908_00595 [Calothrix sp. SM1_7_51]|nr:hypothetical protein [Calothrix sp. SM1_7_51]
MVIFRRLPWVAIALVFLTYGSLGWLIYKAKVPLSIWLLVILAMLLVEGGMTALWTQIAFFWSAFFRSKRRSFFFTLFMSFMLFLIIARFKLFLDSLVVISAIMLGRLDFQTSGFSRISTFWFMSFFSLSGLALGAVLAKLLSLAV